MLFVKTCAQWTLLILMFWTYFHNVPCRFLLEDRSAIGPDHLVGFFCYFLLKNLLIGLEETYQKSPNPNFLFDLNLDTDYLPIYSTTANYVLYIYNKMSKKGTFLWVFYCVNCIVVVLLHACCANIRHHCKCSTTHILSNKSSRDPHHLIRLHKKDDVLWWEIGVGSSKRIKFCSFCPGVG